MDLCSAVRSGLSEASSEPCRDGASDAAVRSATVFVSRNTTPFLAETFVFTEKTGEKRLVVVIRASFSVDAGGRAAPTDRQAPFVYADTPHDDPATTAIEMECEFVLRKSSPEVILHALATAPGGRPVPQLEVALVSPSMRKHAIVSGDRRWLNGAVGIRASDARPFTTLPLAWHRSFGGTDASSDDPAQHDSDLRNPIGRGFQVNSDPAAIERRLLPNIEHPGDRMTHWRQRPQPVGFGPVPRNAQARLRYAGTYDAHWMENVLPFLPADFDDRYFQAAPQDQWVPALTPGDAYLCVHMSPEPRFEFRLPDLPVTITFVRPGRHSVHTPRPDTLIIEPHERRIVLLARASIVLPRKFTRVSEVHVDPRQTPSLIA